VVLTVSQEIAHRRRALHDARGTTSVEHLDAGSRNWLPVLAADLGRLAASLTPLDDVNAERTDPRVELLTLLADAHAWLQAMDERPAGLGGSIR
jgi:hypothetical protein